MSNPWDGVLGTLQDLLDETNWPRIIELKDRDKSKFDLYFTSLETANFQVQTYWAYAVDRKTVPEIAEEMKITEKAVRKRIQKIRDYIALAVTGEDYTWEYRLKAANQLMTEDGLPKPDAIRALGMDAAVYRKFTQRAKKEKQD